MLDIPQHQLTDYKNKIVNSFDFFNVEELQLIQNKFSESTGLASIITSIDGTPITKPSNFTPFCKLIRSTDKGLMNCIKSDVHLSQMGIKNKIAHIQPCLSGGLLDGSLPIIHEGRHLANWMFGQIRTNETSIEEVRRYAETIGSNHNEIAEAYKKTIEMSPERLQCIVTMLELIIEQYISKCDYRRKLEQEIRRTNHLENEKSRIEKSNIKRINAINHGIIVCKKDTSIDFYNNAIKRIFHSINKTDDKIQNLNIELFNDANKKIEFNDYPVNIISKTLLPIENETYRVCINNSDDIWIRLNGAPIFNENNEIAEIIFSMEDISVDKANNDKFIDSIKFLEKTQQIAYIGTYKAKFPEKKWYGSKMLYDIFGYDDQKIKSHDEWFELIHPDYIETLNNATKKVFEGDENNYCITYKIIRKNDGRIRWIRDNGMIVRNNENKVEMTIGTIQDITEIKNAEETALLNEQRFRLVLENAVDVYYKVSNDNKILEVSPSIKHYQKIKSEDIVGKDFSSFFANQKHLQDFYHILNKEGKLNDFCTELILHNDLIINVSISACLVSDYQNRTMYFEGFVRDITKRKQTEYKLKLSEQKFKNYIEFSPHAIVVHNEAGEIIETNPTVSRITGYAQDELFSIPYTDMIDANDLEKSHRFNNRVIKYGLASEEFIITTKNKARKHIQIDSVKLPDGKFITYFVDISYRKKIEEKLVLNQLQLEEAQKIARIGNATVNFLTGYWESSKMLDEIIGIDDNFEKIIPNWVNIIHPDTLEDVKDYFNNRVVLNNEAINIELRIVRRNDKQVRWLHVIGKTEFTPEGKLLKIKFTLQDITERKKFLDQLSQNEAIYRATLNASPDVIAVVDLDGRVKMISPIAKQLYGTKDVNDIIGEHITKFIEPEDFDKLLLNLGQMFEKYLGTIEYNMLRANGDVFPAEVNGDVIRDNNGQPTNMVFIIRDISQRKKNDAALAKSKKQIKEYAKHIQSIREEEKIALAREIHDDLGQILVAMKIEIGMLKKRLFKLGNGLTPEYMDKELERMLDSTNKTINITRRIMSELRTENVKIIGFIESARMYIDNFHERFKTNCNFSVKVPDIAFTRDQTVALYRILQEALNNINKHANATLVTVEVDSFDNSIFLTITDNGCGFDTNANRSVNSFGLIGMHERITLLDGQLHIHSQLEVGTRLSIQIPLIK